jgi:ERCC4-related helicase
MGQKKKNCSGIFQIDRYPRTRFYFNSSTPFAMPDPSMPPNNMNDAWPRLGEMLRRRLRLIGDQALRESDPAAQLDQLRRVSEEITEFHRMHQSQLPAKLNHFLERASFQKALEFLDEQGA